MEYNIFGRTGMKVSDIGFGAWAIGGRGWGGGNCGRGALSEAEAGATESATGMQWKL